MRTHLQFQIQQKQAKYINFRIEYAYETFLCNYNTVPGRLI